ncbi:hypothetical protein [Sinorhizobium psoraleae]|uniref:Uncharacterized protein n=1 Tax=Sinorhizobium psoraleae TaxID=520838 RepID=A0ABT4KMX6_9HYPH|nr:hypothetical protein [Sinorhizobium psoraleae]MCZ4093323.1 hypothetical protein [Sinorhizobium psoraleae]
MIILFSFDAPDCRPIIPDERIRVVIAAPINAIECRLRGDLTNESFLAAAKKIFAGMAHVTNSMRVE